MLGLEVLVPVCALDGSEGSGVLAGGSRGKGRRTLVEDVERLAAGGQVTDGSASADIVGVVHGVGHVPVGVGRGVEALPEPAVAAGGDGGLGGGGEGRVTQVVGDDGR